MSTPTTVRSLVRQSSRFHTSLLPVRVSQRCIHRSSRLRKDEAYTHLQTGPLQTKRAHIGKHVIGQSNTGRQAPTIPSTNSPEEDFPPYTEEELEFLSRKYTPEQMEAIKAGEGAISPKDLQDQGVARNDRMKVDYLDDFARIHPLLDKKVQPPTSHEDLNLRYKTEEEIDEDLARWVESMPENPDAIEWTKFEDSMRFMVGKEEAEREPVEYLQPELPKLTDPLVKRVSKKQDDDQRPMKAEFDALSKLTGLSVDYMRSLRVKVITSHRVVNQTRMGKIQSVYYLAIAGNGNGLIGIGEGKHEEAGTGRTQATMRAIRNMQPIPRYERRTIYGDVRGKVSGTVVELYNRPPGFGVRCQEKIWEVARCAGLTDLAAKTLRSSNPMNTIKATVQALQKQRVPEVVAKSRGKKMVDVRKVYYAGRV